MHRRLAARVLKTTMIFRRMVVEARRKVYKSELWSPAEKAVERDLLLIKKKRINSSDGNENIIYQKPLRIWTG